MLKQISFGKLERVSKMKGAKMFFKVVSGINDKTFYEGKITISTQSSLRMVVEYKGFQYGVLSNSNSKPIAMRASLESWYFGKFSDYQDWVCLDELITSYSVPCTKRDFTVRVD